MRDDQERLLDILEAIARIEKYAARGRSAFEQEELVQIWTVHYLQVIGEAAAKISKEFKLRHSEVAWARLATMRNILVHEYFAVDVEEVWSAVENDLADLKTKIQAILPGSQRDSS
jgi:uncharacterized protein with HEPN domain